MTIVLPVRNGRMSSSSERVTSSRPKATRTIGSRYDSSPITWSSPSTTFWPPTPPSQPR